MSKFQRQSGLPGAIAMFCLLLLASCSSNDNSHTTATTIVTPPPRQVITRVAIQNNQTPADKRAADQTIVQSITTAPGVDPSKPLLIFLSPAENQIFRTGEVVIVEFTLLNAKLKSDGGGYRIRYFVDDDDPQWIDDAKPVGFKGWLPGKHIIRLELIGPDGWPYRNGNQNITTRAISVTAP